MTRGVLFDWDGTIADSAEATFQGYVRVFAAFGIRFERADYARTYSPNWRSTYGAMGLSESRWGEADRLWLESYATQAPSLLPGVCEALLRLKEAGLVRGIVTSGERHRVEGEIARLGLAGLIDPTVCHEDVTRRKPDPQGLLLALERLAIAPASAVLVGDSPEDILMAKAAGVRSIGIPGGFPNRDALVASAPDLLVNDLAEAAAVLLAPSSTPRQ